MTPGSKVKALLYGGEIAERRLIADKGSVIVICAESEWVDAAHEAREPRGLGFPRDCVTDMEGNAI